MFGVRAWFMRFHTSSSVVRRVVLCAMPDPPGVSRKRQLGRSRKLSVSWVEAYELCRNIEWIGST